MKRSEMVAKLTGYLVDYKKHTETEFNARDLAEFMLGCIERQGMLPPHHPNRYGSAWCNHVNWDTEVYEWEEE